MNAMERAEGLIDRDEPDTVRMTVAEATRLCMEALGRIGYPKNEAEVITEQLVDNALCGYTFAGLPRILYIHEDKKSKEPRKPISIKHETPVSAMIDGGNNVGYVALAYAADLAIEKAKKNSFSIVGVFNSYKSGRNAFYVERIVRAGFVAIHPGSAQPRVLPAGALKPALGTNPICIGIPSEQGPVVLDMGTASVMGGELSHLMMLGKEIPEGAGFDAEGHPTRDARKVLEGGGVAAFGGYKGYGLSFAIQALGLLGGAFLARDQVLDYGFLFIVVDPKLLHPDGAFPAQMSELVRKIKSTPRRPGVDDIRIPGERGAREREIRRVQGIVLERKVVEAIEALGR